MDLTFAKITYSFVLSLSIQILFIRFVGFFSTVLVGMNQFLTFEMLPNDLVRMNFFGDSLKMIACLDNIKSIDSESKYFAPISFMQMSSWFVYNLISREKNSFSLSFNMRYQSFLWIRYIIKFFNTKTFKLFATEKLILI